MSDARAAEHVCPVCASPLPGGASLSGGDRLLGVPGSFEVRICQTCGTGATAPSVRGDDLAALYPTGYSSHEAGSSGPPALAAILGALKRAQIGLLLRGEPFAGALGAQPGRALDVGCGRGDLAAALIARGWRVDGVEPSQRASEIACARGVTIVGPTVEHAALTPGGYDLVVMRHSLEHMLDPVGDLGRVREALRPGGRLVISLPNFASWQRRCFGARWFHLDLPRHRVHFSPASLRLALAGAGLQTHMQLTSTSVLGLPASVQYAVAGRCLAAGGIRLRALAVVCCGLFPLTWLADRLGRERDTLHIVAARDHAAPS